MTETEQKIKSQARGEDVYSLFQEIKSKNGKDNLLEHLIKLFETKTELNDDKKYLDLFEDISIRIKKNGKYFEDDLKREALLTYLNDYQANCKAKKELLGPLTKTVDGGDPEIIQSVNFVPEYHNIFKTLEWVGVSIGEKESYLLTNSLRNLVSIKNLPSGINFWGKIFGREKDYYIAEAAGVESSNGKNIFFLAKF